MENHITERLEERNDRWIPPRIRVSLVAHAHDIGAIRSRMDVIRARLRTIESARIDKNSVRPSRFDKNGV